LTLEFWTGKSVLVTGAGGFIASHLVEELVYQGAKVRAFVRYNSRADNGLLNLIDDEIFSKIDIYAGDLRSYETVLDAMQGVTHVFHLGALIAIPYSYVHPQEVVETNVIGTNNILMAARDLGIEKLIHTSSSEVYGTARIVPIDENHPLQGQSPYSASKIGADKLAESYYYSYDLPVVILRPFNTYGPRQSTRAVIPTIITQALTKERINIGNLEARRDLTYVSDTVQGFLRVAEVEGIEGQTFNLGVGYDITIAELINKILKITGRDLEIKVDQNRLRPEKSEVQRLISNNRFAKEKLGWEPKVSLDEGLERTIDWIRNHLNLYNPEKYQI
jgi:NAD dependent epimerase/dehydratase